MVVVVHKQSGRNDLFPAAVITWTFGEDIPEWLSDRAKIGDIDRESGIINLALTPTSSGGYELFTADGKSVLVRTVNKDDMVCKDTKSEKIISLTRRQFELIYD